MRLILAVLTALSALFLLACGDDDAAETGDSDERSEAPKAQPTPTRAQLETIVTAQVPGYASREAGATLLGAGVTYFADRRTAGGAELYVRVTMAACDSFICTSLDPKRYATPEAQRNLQSILPSIHIENPDLKWEWGEFEFTPASTGLFVYSLSYVETRGADGSVSRASANSFRAWHHNGGTYVTLEVFSRSADSVMSKGDLERRMTRAEAEQAAKEVFAVIEPQLPTE